MNQQNKMLMRRGIEDVWSGGDFAVVDELVAGDSVVHGASPGGDLHGPEEVKRFFAAQRAAFPDIDYTIEDQIAEGDRVVTRWTARATHRGAFRGVPPTGKQVHLRGITINRVANGKVVEGWTNADELGLLQQLGVVPSRDGSGAR